MKKFKLNLGCIECDQRVYRWVGQCPGCGEWNTISELSPVSSFTIQASTPSYVRVSEIKERTLPKYKTNFLDIDAAFGGGFQPGSVCLISGEPGVGKSSLLLQMSEHLLTQNKDLKVLYVTGEESQFEISLKCKRLNVKNQELYISNENYLEEIKLQLDDLKPNILIVDSVQMISSFELQASIGGTTQLREVTSELIKLTKSLDMVSFLVGHVNKSSILAGPKTLEHMVDIVVHLKLENNKRSISVSKNRYAPLVSEMPVPMNLT